MDFKELLKWQYVIPLLAFLFTLYVSYIKLTDNVNNLSIKINNTEHEVKILEDQQNRYEVDIALIKNDQTYIKAQQEIIIRKLDILKDKRQ